MKNFFIFSSMALEYYILIRKIFTHLAYKKFSHFLFVVF